MLKKADKVLKLMKICESRKKESTDVNNCCVFD